VIANKKYEENKEYKISKLNDSQVENGSKEIGIYINQHFLFNTLNSILSLCRENSEEARKVVLELSSYLRFNFSVTNEIIFLNEEIDNIKSYLYIQKIRFGTRLNIDYDIDKDVNFLIPKNSLYNLIDNAVNHGILRKDLGGTITLMVNRDKEKIVIKIKDDGIGMDKEQIKSLLIDNCGSLSISSTKYKSLYNSKIEVISNSQIGTCILLYIPIKNIKFI